MLFLLVLKQLRNAGLLLNSALLVKTSKETIMQKQIECNQAQAMCPRCHGLLETNFKVSATECTVILQCQKCKELYELTPFKVSQ